MLTLLCSYGARRPVHLLAHYDDLPTAAAVFAANPKLADDPEALGSAASIAVVRRMSRYASALPRRLSVVKSRGSDVRSRDESPQDRLAILLKFG